MTRALACSLLLFGFAGAAVAAGDAARGARAFSQCRACHSVEAGEHLTGPSLAHVLGRRAASAEGFQRYSDALRKAGIQWNEKTLDRWLASPEETVPGTSMTFPGIKDAQQRQDVIAYLRAVSEDKAAQPAARARRLDLKTAPPEGQVTGVMHCGDTYTVETADGKSQKIWEFNLRIKTDSSKLGPRPRHPVVVGAGMQGDRASLVFASPAEIGQTIRESCP
jgi:cytochrome c